MKSFTRLLHDAHATWLTLLGQPPKICSHLQEDALLQKAGVETLNQSLEAGFYGNLATERHYQWRDAKLYDLHGVSVVGDQGNVFLDNGQFLQLCPSLARLDRRKIRRPIPYFKKKLFGTYFHLTGRDHENHGHFLSQHIPRLLAAREWLEKMGDYRILVAPKHARWQSRYLKILGFDTEKVLEASEGTLWVERLVYVPMWYGDSFLAKSDMYAQISDAFVKFAQRKGFSTEKNGKPLFLSRKDAPNKRLLNEDEIIRICKEQLGELEVFDFKGITFEQQVEKFSKAPWIIGAQGQGLTNLLFTKGSWVVILEAGKSLLGNEGWCLGYRDMALAAGHKSARLISGEDRGENLDWRYPADKFRQDLRRLQAIM